MADKYLIQKQTLDAIANAINAKTGETEKMTPLQMPSKIANIPEGQFITISSSEPTSAQG